MPTSVDTAVARLATRQHGVFSRHQALAAGAGNSRIHRRLVAGRWTIEANGVYALAGGVPTWQRRMMVAHLDLGPESVVSHRAAAVLHAFPGARQGPAELTVPPGTTRSSRWRVHESTVPRADRASVDRLPVTGVTRTILDLAAIMPPARLERLVHDLLAERRAHLAPLTARAAAQRMSGRAGSGMLADLLDELGPGWVPPASDLEARLVATLRAAGLPDPVLQHPLPSLTRAGSVDAAYPAARLIIEADSRRWHTRADDFERDRHRDIEAGLCGWTVVRITWADLVDRPSWVVDVVAHHLRRAAA